MEQAGKDKLHVKSNLGGQSLTNGYLGNQGNTLSNGKILGNFFYSCG